MVYRGAGLRAAGRQGAVLPHKSQIDNEEDNERKREIIQVETNSIEYPSWLSKSAVSFI